MAKLLLNLRHVPDDEADDVRALLEEHHVDFYETDPGNWWISAGGIWIREDDQFPRAKELMDAYQKRRAEAAQAAHREAVREGRAETLKDVVLRDPGRVAAMVGGMVLILLLMALPVVLLFR